ncbi:MAG: hypothetical protein IKR94_10190 [Bacteroidales bacterium]|nr:hypothetical protein [Bacteroidales bacterium]
MKKIYLFMTMAMMAFATAFTACEDEQVNPDNNDPQNNGDENANYQMYSFNTKLSYDGTKLSNPSGFCASTQQAVPANNPSSDINAAWQNQYGYMLCSPKSVKGQELYECYSANSLEYVGYNSTKIQNLGFVDIDDYYDVNTLEKMSVGTSYIDDKSSLGVGVNKLQNGQVIAFQTSDGCKGVMQVVTVAKIPKYITVKGYVAVPKNSSGK